MATFENVTIKKKSVPKDCIEGGDIALFEVEPTFISSEFCTEISWEMKELGSSVVAIGFPKAINRELENAGDSDGQQVYATFGQVQKKNTFDVDGNPNQKSPLD